MASSESKKSPAVRRKPDRSGRIIHAARVVFLAHGFNGATTDMIQAQAGVSKATIYRYFPTKEILFEEAMAENTRAFLSNVDYFREHSENVEAFLTSFGMEFIETLLEPHALDTLRLMVTEGPRFSKLGMHFYLNGPKRVADMVEQYLGQAHARGELELASPVIAAEHFISMIRGEIYLRCLLGVSKPPNPAQLKRYVAATVSAFMSAYRPREQRS